MNWRAALLENWPYKAAALILALLLWVNVSVEERQERAVPTLVEWPLADSGYAVVDAPDTVNTLFQGRSGDILDLVVGEPPVIRYRVDSLAAGTRTVRIGTEMVEYARATGARPVAVRPSRIEIRLEQVAAKRVPVQPDLTVRPAEGFIVVGEVTVEPESVTVRGPASEVEAVAVLKTDSVTLEGLSRTERTELRVSVPATLSHLEARPRIVLATVPIDSLVERSFRVPVELPEAIPASLVAVPDSVQVRVRGPARSMQDVSAASVQAVARLRGAGLRRDTAGDAISSPDTSAVAPEAAAGMRLPVEAVLPPDTLLTGVVEPGEIELRAASGGA